jgi:hypothetical protein
MEAEEASMGATILEGGDASQLFKAEYLEAQPQVHIHFMTDDDEFERTGNGRIELVCHGCGASLLVLYDRNKKKRKLLEIRQHFSEKHLKCPNIGYEKNCPNYRSSFASVDTRKALSVYQDDSP